MYVQYHVCKTVMGYGVKGVFKGGMGVSQFCSLREVGGRYIYIPQKYLPTHSIFHICLDFTFTNM